MMVHVSRSDTASRRKQIDKIIYFVGLLMTLLSLQPVQGSALSGLSPQQLEQLVTGCALAKPIGPLASSLVERDENGPNLNDLKRLGPKVDGFLSDLERVTVALENWLNLRAELMEAQRSGRLTAPQWADAKLINPSVDYAELHSQCGSGNRADPDLLMAAAIEFSTFVVVRADEYLDW